MRRAQGLLCAKQLGPASSPMGSLQDRAESITQDGGTFGETFKKEKKKYLVGETQREGWWGQRGRRREQQRAAGGAPHWSRYVPKGTVAQGGTTPEDREKVSDREWGEGNSRAPALSSCVTHHLTEETKCDLQQ